MEGLVMNTTTMARTSAASVRTSRPALGAARLASLALAVVMTVSAAAGLAVRGVYQDADGVVALLRGYDLVALAIGVPLLMAVVLRRTPRGLLLWAGVLVYAAYNYAYYLFGTELNALFGLHAAVFALSVAGLVLLLASVDVRGIAARYHPRTPVRSVGGALLALGAALAAMWLVGVGGALATGSALDEPSQLIVPASFTHLGAALDLAVLVPAYAVAGVLLWRRAAWGYVAATALLVAGVLHQIAYMTALVFQATGGIPGASAFDAAEPVIVGVFAVAAALMLGNCRGRSRSSSSTR
jgi:hypothetical protein